MCTLTVKKKSTILLYPFVCVHASARVYLMAIVSCFCLLMIISIFSVPTSGPHLVYPRPWYVLFCLWKSAYKISLAAY